MIACRPDEDLTRIGTYSHKITLTRIGYPNPSAILVAFLYEQLDLWTESEDLLWDNPWGKSIYGVIISRKGIVEYNLSQDGERGEDELTLGEVAWKRGVVKHDLGVSSIE